MYKLNRKRASINLLTKLLAVSVVVLWKKNSRVSAFDELSVIFIPGLIAQFAQVSHHPENNM